MKRLAIAITALSVLGLTACAAGGESVAREACISDAKEQRPDIKSWDFSDVETFDLSEAMFETGGTSSLDDNNRMWASNGEVTYKSGDKTHKKSMVCFVTIKNGEVTESADAILN
ncbi:hypothetical protein FB472_1963 [Rhodoglobus vestalii]|uniref:Lipoprotein n=1 Tax=Rhodoglobus vestalii TaxID=193384 RepID=A0A8H2PV11_9MICO|nr:hypothetical protein [Rhodoglobus vestalii]TQO20332.1 hypothetical protein FB472_1963 [Rhodoglobus vestalii]